MPLTILDIDESEIDSAAKIAEWEQEFQQRFTAPLEMARSIIELMSLPPEAIEWIKANKPDDFARANRYIQQTNRSVV